MSKEHCDKCPFFLVCQTADYIIIDECMSCGTKTLKVVHIDHLLPRGQGDKIDIPASEIPICEMIMKIPSTCHVCKSREAMFDKIRQSMEKDSVTSSGSTYYSHTFNNNTTQTFTRIKLD